MIYLLAGVITVVCLAAVLAPLWRPARAFAPWGAPGPDVKADLLREKEEFYAALRELEQDRRAGKFSDSDYEDLKRDYETSAVTILKELDEIAERK